ncbi:MAG: Histidine kinase, partial [Bacteroidota bacterium]
MNFNSLETERKRISNDLHDHMGYKILIINKSLENLKSNSLLKNNTEIERIESQVRLFQYDIRKVLESIHPRDL